MAIQDKDAERRNLVITSLSFILFYLAGGHITESTLKLQIINISFTNTDVLVIAAWLMIIWFALRYWQTHKNLVSQEIVNDVSSLRENKALINFIKKTTNKEYRVNNGFDITSIQKNHGIWSVTYAKVTNTKHNKKGKLITQSHSHAETVELENIKGKILIIRLYLEAIITKPGFTSFAVPYLLFYTAVFLSINAQYEKMF